MKANQRASQRTKTLLSDSPTRPNMNARCKVLIYIVSHPQVDASPASPNCWALRPGACLPSGKASPLDFFAKGQVFMKSTIFGRWAGFSSQDFFISSE